MKVFVAVLALVACVSAGEWTVKNGEQLKEIRNECLKEHPLTTEQMSKLSHFEFPNEEGVRQYILCSAVKMGIYCTHMGYHTDRIAKQFKMDMDEEEVKKLADDCVNKNPKGDKPHDVVTYENHICFMDTVVGDKIKDYLKKRHEAA